MNTRRKGRGGPVVVRGTLLLDDGEGADVVLVVMSGCDDEGGTGGSTPISIVDDGVTVLGDIAEVVTAQPVADMAIKAIRPLVETCT